MVVGACFDSMLNCGVVSWKSAVHNRMFQSSHRALHSLMITRNYVVEWTPKPPVHPEYRVAKAEPKPKEPWERPYVDHAKSTRVLLVLLEQARTSGRAPNGATYEELKAILATREHLPSAKELRQRKAKEKRYR